MHFRDPTFQEILDESKRLAKETEAARQNEEAEFQAAIRASLEPNQGILMPANNNPERKAPAPAIPVSSYNRYQRRPRKETPAPEMFNYPGTESALGAGIFQLPVQRPLSEPRTLTFKDMTLIFSELKGNYCIQTDLIGLAKAEKGKEQLYEYIRTAKLSDQEKLSIWDNILNKLAGEQLAEFFWIKRKTFPPTLGRGILATIKTERDRLAATLGVSKYQEKKDDADVNAYVDLTSWINLSEEAWRQRWKNEFAPDFDVYRAEDTFKFLQNKTLSKNTLSTIATCLSHRKRVMLLYILHRVDLKTRCDIWDDILKHNPNSHFADYFWAVEEGFFSSKPKLNEGILKSIEEASQMDNQLLNPNMSKPKVGAPIHRPGNINRSIFSAADLELDPWLDENNGAGLSL